MNRNSSMQYLAILACFFLIIPNLFSQSKTKEPHLSHVRQLTFGGDNAEAYFSFDGKRLSFQSNNPAWGLQCDQIFAMDISAAADAPSYRPPLISTGLGRTTCAYFMPDDKHILYASTHEGGTECPPPPPERTDRKYLWQIFSTFDIYVADLQGKIVRKLTNSPGYDAEGVVSPDGTKIVFTSDRSGDLELWLMDIDGSNQRQVTNTPGYDGGAFFTPDSKGLVFRASRPKTDSALQEYRELLKQGLVAPTEMEIFTCNLDGSNMKQITNLGKANWAPYMHPNGKKIIFSSNHHSQRGYDFQLYTINTDGTGLEQITSESIFNAFAMFSTDGKKIVFSSNRNNKGTRDTNVFIADWTD
ncbi:MAG: PD40 domain-containing protein [Flavobacteriales bacterium]|nr:PD40 domain-containing protein [Flavobacteriales bacterium]MBW7853859.1 PD40 domain-containing protein [Candidatus Kapabacteria bacterium]